MKIYSKGVQGFALPNSLSLQQLSGPRFSPIIGAVTKHLRRLTLWYRRASRDTGGSKPKRMAVAFHVGILKNHEELWKSWVYKKKARQIPILGFGELIFQVLFPTGLNRKGSEKFLFFSALSEVRMIFFLQPVQRTALRNRGKKRWPLRVRNRNTT